MLVDVARIFPHGGLPLRYRNHSVGLLRSPTQKQGAAFYFIIEIVMNLISMLAPFSALEMVRNAPTSSKGNFTDGVLAKALSAVKNGDSVRKAGRDHGIDRITLSRYVKKKNSMEADETVKRVRPGKSTVFTHSEERELAEHIKAAARMFHGLSINKARELAYQYAKTIAGKETSIPSEWETSKMAGEGWLSNFRKRNTDISLRKPQPTSLARANAFSRESVAGFFNNLDEIRSIHPFQPHRIFNLDESGTTTVQTPPRVLAHKGVKQLGFISSAERGSLVTFCPCVSATGQALPPVYIFPRVNFQDHMLNGAPQGSLGLASKSGWMTEELFLKTLEHYQSHWKATKEDPILLLMDNHSTHCSGNAIRFAESNFIYMLTFPPHCSHRMQPLDVSVFRSYKSFYNQACSDWMLSNPGKHITIYNIGELSAKAFFRSFTPSNIMSGFRSTGISPHDRDIFGDEAFVADALREASNPTTPSGTPTTPSAMSSLAGSPVSAGGVLPALPSIPGPSSSSTNRPKQTSRILTRPSTQMNPSSDENEPVLNDDSEASSIGDSEEEEPSLPEDRHIEAGSFVVVSVANEQNRHHQNFIGEVLRHNGEAITVKFLKKSQKGRHFLRVSDEDENEIDLQDVLVVLPTPDKSGGTHRRAAMLTFPHNLIALYNIN